MTPKTFTFPSGKWAGWELRVKAGRAEARVAGGDWAPAPLRPFAVAYPVGDGPWPWLLEHGIRRPSPNGPSGPTQSAEARRAAGRVRLDTWISREAAERLDKLTGKWRLTKRETLEHCLLHWGRI